MLCIVALGVDGIDYLLDLEQGANHDGLSFPDREFENVAERQFFLLKIDGPPYCQGTFRFRATHYRGTHLRHLQELGKQASVVSLHGEH